MKPTTLASAAGRSGYRAAWALTLAGALAATPAAAFTKIEGEYQLMLDMRKYIGHRAYPWAFDSNNDDNGDYADLRIFTQPRGGVEAFLKLQADWHGSKNNSERPVLQFSESHVRFRWEKFGRGLDSHLFSRQDRFWVDNYLLRVVESGDDGKAPLRNANWGPNAQGVRVDSWGFLGLNTSWIMSDFSGQYPFQRAVDRTDDAFVGRVRRESKGKTLRLGSTFVRVQQVGATVGGVQQAIAPSVLAFDARYTFRGINYSLEYAQGSASQDPLAVKYPDALNRSLRVFGRPTGIRLSDRGVLVAEARAFRLGAPRFGYFNFSPIYWRRGALYVNAAGDNSFQGEQKTDEIGFGANGWYLFPERSITWTTNYKNYSRLAYQRREVREFYNELHIEFVNGFTGKTYLRNYALHTVPAIGRDNREYYNTWFGELQVESRLAWLRLQSKYRDIDHPFRKQVFSLETRINLTDKLKTYNQYAFANDPVGVRKGIFSQLQYYPSSNVLMFLEYGPGWIGDSGTPVDDGDLENTGDQVDMIKFILKGTF